MPNSLHNFTTRAVYGAEQLTRMAWYVSHGLIVRWLGEAARQREGESPRPRPQTEKPVGRSRFYAEIADLFRKDLANVEAGLYPLPADHDGSLLTQLQRSRLFFSDLPDVHRRRESGQWNEVQTEANRTKRPLYYLQNFHFQSGGYLSEDSALRYDTQVEVLFSGTANTIRRQALPPLKEIFAGRDQRRLNMLDIGCGTGRFLDFAKQAWPRLPMIGLDLSEPYLAEAKRHLFRWSWLDFVLANAEAIPLPDESLDAMTSVFVFHELPPKVRQQVFTECARLLKSGGRLVLVDSFQRGDRPAYEGMLELFPQSFHEPYFLSYIEEDFPSLAQANGLIHRRNDMALLAKIMVFDKP